MSVRLCVVYCVAVDMRDSSSVDYNFLICFSSMTRQMAICDIIRSKKRLINIGTNAASGLYGLLV